MLVKTRIELLAFGKPGEERYAEFEVGSQASIDHLLGLAFHFGQNDFQPQPHPSASVGDVIWMNGHRFLIQGVGFKELTVEELVAYRAMDRRERQFSALLG